jgi:hypothetical protein
MTALAVEDRRNAGRSNQSDQEVETVHEAERHPQENGQPLAPIRPQQVEHVLDVGKPEACGCAANDTIDPAVELAPAQRQPGSGGDVSSVSGANAALDQPSAQ